MPDAVASPWPHDLRARAGGITLLALAFIYLEVTARLAGSDWGWQGSALRLALTTGTLAIALLAAPHKRDENRRRIAWIGPGILVATSGAWIVCALTESTVAAWIALAGYFAVSLRAAGVLADSRWRPLRWALRIGIGIAFVLVPIAIDQVMVHFAEEEFFAALQAVQLAPWWLMLQASITLLAQTGVFARSHGPTIDPRWTCLGAGGLAVIGVLFIVRSYQSSFFPLQAPVSPGLTANSPFECEMGADASPTYDGLEVHRALLAAVEANPGKSSPEYGMLALGTGQARWAEAFRASLLEEATRSLFTHPANSVKSVQHDAALRAYYYPRVAGAFPGLFSEEDTTRLRTWFADVNRRALTVEWVDWLYGLAFSKWPEGPYENQESGAGLLALLEAGGLAAPELAEANTHYLQRAPRGWEAGFRNTDDAYLYQPEWITNAYFQSLYQGTRMNQNAANAFEWLLVQALPDGQALRYNHPSAPSLAGPAYLGAVLLGDPRYVWLAGRALEALHARGGYLAAQPGAEAAIAVVGQSPREKSCLVYGDSGLPTRSGPLAPDKIVLRSGWRPDSLYLLLNLRFSGWHRYKATGTVSLIYQGQPLVIEDSLSAPASWLPAGRSLFRDKRIPRENLNGLIVERRGLNRVLATMTGLGGPWAQDPPYYALVRRFDAGEAFDLVEIVVADWHGWSHTRRILFNDEGIVVVVDEASGPKGSEAGLVWHVSGMARRGPHGELLLGAEGQASAALLPLTPGKVAFPEDDPASGDSPGELSFVVDATGELKAVTVFLTGEWAGAIAALSEDQQYVVLSTTTGSRTIPLLRP